MPLVGVELSAIGIQPLDVDVDIAFPVDDDFDAAFRVISHGVGDAGHDDFAVVSRLAAVDRMLRDEPWPQLGDFGDVQCPHDRLCDFARRDPVAGSVGRRN